MRYLFVFLILNIFISGVMAQIPDEIIEYEKIGFQKRKRIEKRDSDTAFHGFSIHYHRCIWKLNPRINANLNGRVLFGIQLLDNLDSIAIDLVSGLGIDSVIYHGKKANFTRKLDKVYIYHPSKWFKNSRDSFEVYYSGNPISAGSGYGAYVYDNHSSGPIIQTLSQPYGAPFWWPCKQTLSDKIDSMDIYIETAKDLKAGSNGKLMRVTPSKDINYHIFHWKHRFPIATYLVAIAVSNYAEFTDYAHFAGKTDSLAVVNYVFPQFEAKSRIEAKRVLPMLRLFDSLFTPYPFMTEKYGHAQFTSGGGMEHQTMSFMVNFSFDLIAHELAHQWFGDMITCASWNDLWLNEGFATYLTAVCFEYIESDEVFKDKMRGMRGDITSDPDGSVFPKDTNIVNVLFNGRLTYRKGAWLLHMLRVRLGDSLFFEGCRNYLKSNSAYGFSTTAQFQKIMEDVSGIDLGVFFKQWYLGEGFPYLKINWKQRGKTVELKIDQTPSNSNVPFWDVNIPILFKNSTESVLLEFRPDSLSKIYKFDVPFGIDTAIFDPNVTLLAKASMGGFNLSKIQQEEIVIFPVPANDVLSISSRNPNILKVEMYNSTGAFLKEQSFQNEKSVNIETKHLPDGYYFIKVYTKDFVYSNKWLK